MTHPLIDPVITLDHKSALVTLEEYVVILRRPSGIGLTFGS
jgi:hypothetical protein